MVVAGDIFDSLNPSAEAQRLLFETLKELRAALPRATIALLAGNHDPAGRLEAPRALFDLIGVVSVGTIARREGGIDPKVHLVPLRDASGAVAAHLLAAPYPRAADLAIVEEEISGSPIVFAVRQLYAELIAMARADICANIRFKNLKHHFYLYFPIIVSLEVGLSCTFISKLVPIISIGETQCNSEISSEGVTVPKTNLPMNKVVIIQSSLANFQSRILALAKYFKPAISPPPVSSINSCLAAFSSVKSLVSTNPPIKSLTHLVGFFS